MPRVSKAEMERNREEIERASSRLMRERGLAVSLVDLMGAAGLTHGGFYKHFASKDDLAAVVCTRAFAESAQRWEKRAGATNIQSARAAIIDGYFNANEASNPDSSCPMAALAVDVSRKDDDKEVGRAFSSGVERLVNILANHQEGVTETERMNKSFVDVAAMVGALVLARATKGSLISDVILQSTREALLGKNSFGSNAG